MFTKPSMLRSKKTGLLSSRGASVDSQPNELIDNADPPMIYQRNSPIQRKNSQDGAFPRLRLEEQLSICKKPMSLLSADKDFEMERGEMFPLDNDDGGFIVERKIAQSCPTCGSSLDRQPPLMNRQESALMADAETQSRQMDFLMQQLVLGDGCESRRSAKLEHKSMLADPISMIEPAASEKRYRNQIDLSLGKRRRERKVQSFAAYRDTTMKRIEELKQRIANVPEDSKEAKKWRNQISAYQTRLRNRAFEADLSEQLKQKDDQMRKIEQILSEELPQERLAFVMSRIQRETV